MRVTTLDKVKTTAFVLKNRLLGYKLLQNAKGTNPNEVTMIKTWFGVDPVFYDKHHHYHRIHRYPQENTFVKDELFLMAGYFMDTDTKTYSGKRKNLNGYIIKNGKLKSLDKTNVSQNDLFERSLPDWRDGNEEYDFGEKLFIENRKSEYNLSTPGFWQILRNNLKG